MHIKNATGLAGAYKTDKEFNIKIDDCILVQLA